MTDSEHAKTKHRRAFSPGNRSATAEIVRFAVAAAAAVIVALAASAAPAAARTPAWCSESGDMCLSVVGSGDARYAQARFADRYMRSALLCLHAPDGRVACRRGPLKFDRGAYAVKKRLSSFPDHGPGEYGLSWAARRSDVHGPELTFRVR